MLTIPAAGNKYDFYSSTDGIDIGVFPGGTISSIPDPLPIRLQRGDRTWGGLHIATKHGHWLKKQQLDVHEMVWLKLRQQGAVYTTEENGKLKISLRIHPAALLILRLIDTGSEIFLTVVSVYFHPQSLDGDKLCDYRPTQYLPGGDRKLVYPAFSLPSSVPPELAPANPSPPPAPTVKYKKKREFVAPGNDE